jgi:NAD(P)-dependent dehydrogenase (short-subunit alcohol dehydrogenase family)
MKKNVLITGASRGIGFALAKQLSLDGYQVIGVARQLPQDGFPGVFLKGDLSLVDETQALLEKVSQEYTLYGVINNVGITAYDRFGNIDLEVFHRMMDLNVRTAIQVSQHFIEPMKQAKAGRIINMSSLAIHGIVNRSVYAATKSALVGLTRTWALELAPFNITVNAIAPGAIETEMFRNVRPAGSPEEQALLSKIPLGRLGKPEEVAALASLFISDVGGFITGQVFAVDGGASI